MQAGRRLVEDEQIAALPFRSPAVRQMPDELESLRFSARKCVQRLAESQITEPDFVQNFQRTIFQRFFFADLREKLDRFADCQLENS